ncbi:MAG: hypothetical protein RL326_391 [Pseudomonadota bacterium]
MNSCLSRNSELCTDTPEDSKKCRYSSMLIQRFRQSSIVSTEWLLSLIHHCVLGGSTVIISQQR